jgi:2-polyprenyl-6-methoxyphenol hydroxylase-like FAD-dependent oxidoreductase
MGKTTFDSVNETNPASEKRFAFDVAIVGGGIGGLCLAQGLKKAGVSAKVYERDVTPTSRLQGFRIHIDPDGSAALHQCLPQPLWDIFAATEGEFGQGITMMSEQLGELLRFGGDGEADDPVARHRSISRITLRQVLLSGLGENVCFDKRFVRYEEMPNGRFALYFEDGSRSEADVVVGADGVHSRVRQQYMPGTDPVDTGVVGLGGKVPLTDGVMALVPGRLLDGPVMVLPNEPCSLFMAIWRRSPEANKSMRLLGLAELPQGDEDYLVLGFGGRPEHFGLNGALDSHSGHALKNAMRRAAAGWHPTLRKLVEMVDAQNISVNRLHTSQRIAPWETTRVTLLGDAIHSMTPYRGIGANIALKDAALLCEKLIQVHRGNKSLLEAIAEYEADMREYAFAAVEASRRSMEQAVGEKRAFGIAKAAMRVMNAVPSLRRRLLSA